MNASRTIAVVGVFACALLLAPGAAAQDAGEPTRDAASDAFVELSAGPPRAFAHQVVTLRLRFGFEARFLADDLVPLFRRALDVPVQVVAPALEDPRLLPAGGGDAEPSDGASFALDDAVARARRLPDELRDGRAFAVFELLRRVSVDAPGEIDLGTAGLRFAYATRFRDDLVLGRVPDERLVDEVASAPATLSVLPWPDAGRPAGFTGAVGRFALDASLAARELDLGAATQLVLRVTALDDADVTRFDAPTLDELSDAFHVLGRLDRVEGRSRVFSFDVQPLRADVDALPALAFPYLDPGPPARWAVARSEPIALRVRDAEGAAARALAPERTPGVDDVHGFRDPRSAPAVPRRPSLGSAVAWLGLPWLLAGALALLGRRRERDLSDPLGVRARHAVRGFERHLEVAPDAPHEALAEYLAARLRLPAAAVVTPELEALLARRDVPRELAARAATTLHALVAARYAGGAARGADPGTSASGARAGAHDGTRRELHRLVAALEAHFSAHGDPS
ncbi:MAG: BatD family protein [Planctomycetes bacterium]|nr:BatD family protein [Planctomycetota bacterium]